MDFLSNTRLTEDFLFEAEDVRVDECSETASVDASDWHRQLLALVVQFQQEFGRLHHLDALAQPRLLGGGVVRARFLLPKLLATAVTLEVGVAHALIQGPLRGLARAHLHLQFKITASCMKIELATLSNAKLLQYFPVDPYFDLEVKSATGEYKLQIAFLSIESEFFEEVYSTKQRTVDLSHLPEPYLEGVLRALYGDGLVIETFNDLRNYFTVIEYLRVGEYRQGIIDGL